MGLNVRARLARWPLLSNVPCLARHIWLVCLYTPPPSPPVPRSGLRWVPPGFSRTCGWWQQPSSFLSSAWSGLGLSEDLLNDCLVAFAVRWTSSLWPRRHGWISSPSRIPHPRRVPDSLSWHAGFRSSRRGHAGGSWPSRTDLTSQLSSLRGQSSWHGRVLLRGRLDTSTV
jgi:hypothetical protein